MKIDEAGRVNVNVPSVKDILGKKHPEKKFRAGAVSATIWLNKKIEDGKESSFRTVSFEKNYTDKEGKWHTTNSLSPSDIPKALVVLNKAYEYIYLQEINDEE